MTGDGLKSDTSKLFDIIDEINMQVGELKEKVENLAYNYSDLEKKYHDWYIQLESLTRKVEKEITGKLEELNNSYKEISVNVDELERSVLPGMDELKENSKDLISKYSELTGQQHQYQEDLDYWAKKVDTVETEIPKNYEELKKVETKLEEKLEKEVITKIEQLKADSEELFQKYSQLETNQRLSRENINRLEDKLEQEALVGIEELRKKNAELSEKIRKVEDEAGIDELKVNSEALSQKYHELEQDWQKYREELTRLTEKIENEVIGELEELKKEKDESTDMTITGLSSRVDELSEKYSTLSDHDDKLEDVIEKSSKPIIKKEISQELEKFEKKIHDQIRKKIHEMKVEIVKEITKDRKLREDKPSALESVKRSLEIRKPAPGKDHTDMLDTFEERDLGRFIEKIDVEGTENGELFKGKSGYFFIKRCEKGYQLFLDKKITNESPHPNIRKIIKPFFEVTNMERSTYKLTYPALVDWDERTGRGSIIEKGVVIF
jgi:chromosome segregation ATPase